MARELLCNITTTADFSEDMVGLIRPIPIPDTAVVLDRILGRMLLTYLIEKHPSGLSKIG